jgi:tripartite-type tricarboxylate transporter receptor subunit TctC
MTAILAAGAMTSASLAQTPVDFSGKTITIVVGFPPGGDYDSYARITANNLGRHLKGNPTVVVQNMPGAGGVVTANYLFNAARKDGTFLGVVAQTAAIAQVTGVKGVKYDVGKFNWIGRVNSNVEVQQIWHTSLVKTIADAKIHEVTVAGTGSTSSSVVFPNLLDKMFGMKFKVVPGYQGVNMATLAMERGEVAGIAGPWSLSKAAHSDWLRDKKINTIVQYVVKRHADLQDVPAVVDLATNELQRQILGLYASGADIGRSIVAPPAIPEPVVLALRAGFNATMKDSRFLDEIRKSRLEFDPLEGEKLQRSVAKLQQIPSDVIAEARRLTGNTK